MTDIDSVGFSPDNELPADPYLPTFILRGLTRLHICFE